jgi:transposase
MFSTYRLSLVYTCSNSIETFYLWFLHTIYGKKYVDTRSNKSVPHISALLELPQSTVSAVIVKWKCLGATMAQPRSGRPHKLTEQDRRELKRVARKNSLSSVGTLTIEFQTASGSNISTTTVCRELHEMAFHGRAATQD